MIVTPQEGGPGHRCRTGTSTTVNLMLGIAALCAMAAPRLPAQDLSLKELRRISATASDLSRVAEASVGADGTIWIFQPEDGVIAGFAPNSTKPQLVGRAGAGPGDIRNLAQVLVRPNDLWIVDWTLLRSTSFDVSGRATSTAPIPRPNGLTSPRLRAATPAGASWWQSHEQDGSTTYWTLLGNGASRQAVLRWLPTSCSLSRRTQRGAAAIFVPYCHMPRIAFSANGEFAAEAIPLTLVDRSDGLQVTVVSVKGDTVFSRRLSLAASPIPSATRDSAINYRLGRARGLHRELYQEMVNQDLVPRVYSPVVDLRVSDAGDVVLDVVEGRAAERRLVVLRRDSRAVSMLPMTSAQSLLWFGGNRLLLTDEAEDGLQDVVLYEIVGNR